MGTKFLSRKDILTADDIKTEEVDVPEWETGGVQTLLVRGLTGKEKDIFFGSFVDVDGNPALEMLENATARALAICIVDENGTPLFTKHDVAALGEKSGEALGRVWAVAQRISGLSPKSIKALTENLGKGQNGTSTSR